MRSLNRCYLVLFFCLCSSSLHSQAAPLRDTSFNIPATFFKEEKKRPYITIANPEVPKNITIRQEIVFRTIGHRELTLDIYYPKTGKTQRPAVLLIFGGGWRSGDKSHNRAMSIELAANGYVSVSAEYRLSPEAPYPAALYDLKAAVGWMRAHSREYRIDSNKIAALGCSAGGQLAALLGTTNGDEDKEDRIGNTSHGATVQAVIDIDGILAFHHPESVEGAVAAQWLNGTYEQRPDVWEDAAPLNHVNPRTSAFLFVNSSLPRFHAGRDDMIRKMAALHLYAEVHTIEDTPHPFWFFNPWFKPMMGYIIKFLNKQFV